MNHTDNVLDLNPGLLPSAIYWHPRDVLADDKLTKSRKREILASWASDAAAVPSNPALRRLPGSHCEVSIDDVMAALLALDSRPSNPPGGKPARIGSVWRAGIAA